MPSFPKIASCLWFDGRAEEAARFYVSVFRRSRITRISRHRAEDRDVHDQPPGRVLSVAFELQGHPFTALNAGPQFRFDETVSLQVVCATQHEIDHLSRQLGAGSDPSVRRPGWLKDRYGISWQVVPEALPVLIADRGARGVAKITRAMREAEKPDVRARERPWSF